MFQVKSSQVRFRFRFDVQPKICFQFSLSKVFISYFQGLLQIRLISCTYFHLQKDILLRRLVLGFYILQSFLIFIFSVFVTSSRTTLNNVGLNTPLCFSPSFPPLSFSFPLSSSLTVQKKIPEKCKQNLSSADFPYFSFANPPFSFYQVYSFSVSLTPPFLSLFLPLTVFSFLFFSVSLSFSFSQFLFFFRSISMISQYKAKLKENTKANC